jgi:hypothetical protein
MGDPLYAREKLGEAASKEAVAQRSESRHEFIDRK